MPNNIITLKHKDFIHIIDNNNSYYGGSQLWFPQKLARKSACATIAAANTFCYLSITNEQYKALSPFTHNTINKSDYLNYMQEIYHYIMPIHLGNLSIGIPTLSNFRKKVYAYTNQRQIELNHYIFNQAWTLDNTYYYIESALTRNKPVILLNTYNPKLKSVEYTTNDDRHCCANFDKHWLTITELKLNEKQEPVISVSSWGHKVELELARIIIGGAFKAMIYFN